MPLGCSWPVALFGNWTQPELLRAQGGGCLRARHPHTWPKSPTTPPAQGSRDIRLIPNARCHPGVPSRESRAPPTGGPPPWPWNPALPLGVRSAARCSSQSRAGGEWALAGCTHSAFKYSPHCSLISSLARSKKGRLRAKTLPPPLRPWTPYPCPLLGDEGPDTQAEAYIAGGPSLSTWAPSCVTAPRRAEQSSLQASGAHRL